MKQSGRGLNGSLTSRVSISSLTSFLAATHSILANTRTFLARVARVLDNLLHGPRLLALQFDNLLSLTLLTLLAYIALLANLRLEFCHLLHLRASVFRATRLKGALF